MIAPGSTLTVPCPACGDPVDGLTTANGLKIERDNAAGGAGVVDLLPGGHVVPDGWHAIGPWAGGDAVTAGPCGCTLTPDQRDRVTAAARTARAGL